MDKIKKEKEKMIQLMIIHFEELKLILEEKSNEGAIDKDEDIAELVIWHNLLDDLFYQISIGQ